MKRFASAAAVLFASSLVFAGGEGPVKYHGELLKRCKIDMKKAIEKALEACPGNAVATRLTTDDDGAPVFRVTVHRGDSESNVWVDAVEGKAKIKDTLKDEDEPPKGE